MGALHVKLKEYRVWQTTIIVFLCGVMVWLLKWMTATPYVELQNWAVAPFATAVPALITGLFKMTELFMANNSKS